MNAKKGKNSTSQIKCGNFVPQLTLWLSGVYNAIFRDNEKSRSICIKFCVGIQVYSITYLQIRLDRKNVNTKHIYVVLMSFFI